MSPDLEIGFTNLDSFDLRSIVTNTTYDFGVRLSKIGELMGDIYTLFPSKISY